MITKSALVTLSLMWNFVAPLAGTGKPRAICPNPATEAVEGDRVTLPCYVSTAQSVVDCAVDWTRDDLNKGVYSYRGKQENPNDQMNRYKGRATLHLEDLSRGNVTLQIFPVQLSDSGPYRCFVSRLRISCVVNVTVVTKDQLNTTKRDDDNTTTPPPDEPDLPEGGNRNAVRAGIIPTVVFLIGVLIVVLVIWEHIMRLRGRWEQQAQAASGGA